MDQIHFGVIMQEHTKKVEKIAFLNLVIPDHAQKVFKNVIFIRCEQQPPLNTPMYKVLKIQETSIIL